MRGVTEGRGESLPQSVFAEVPMKEERYAAILPPVLRFAWTSPLVNEGGKRQRAQNGRIPKVDNTTSIARIIPELETKCKERNRLFTNASHPRVGGVVYLSRRKE